MVDFQSSWIGSRTLHPYGAKLTQRMRSRYRLAAILSRFHRFIYVFFNGRFLSRRGSASFLLLTTKGRRSNRMRTVALLYVSHRGNPSVIASFGGSPRPPGWVLNIQDDPKVKVQIGGVRREGVARIAAAEERRELWPRFIECFSGYERYQARTTRQFPMVIITLPQD